MRFAHMRRGLSAAVLLAACGDDGDATGPGQSLEVTSVSPAPDASGVETGAIVAVVFSQAIDPATLTSETFRVRVGGEPLATALSYEAATRTARAAAPLVPGAGYEAEVTTEVRTSGGMGLSAPEVWEFATRDWEAVTVDDTGTYTFLAVDGSGRVHMSYSDATNFDLKYIE